MKKPSKKRDPFNLPDYAELLKLKKYAMKHLTPEEKLLVKTMSKRLTACKNGKNNDFVTLNGDLKMSRLWRKYQYLKPFFFKFDPEKLMPEIFKNQEAFIIWTVWRSDHLLGEEDLNRAALLAGNILGKFKPPYPPKAKKEAMKKFEAIIGFEYQDNESWETRIFPFLEGTWKFKYKLTL